MNSVVAVISCKCAVLTNSEFRDQHPARLRHSKSVTYGQIRKFDAFFCDQIFDPAKIKPTSIRKLKSFGRLVQGTFSEKMRYSLVVYII